ncbi:DUF6887 family protein [Aulosira sp. FACHB-615]|uniref:DUF6887 family protein n=1 Tax=Aulosira sp. FACHB-615 TaxID=2692777 RepID=UPI0016820977|nr:hypothetical protein [Aulosira sp. FACHB-615]MBD2489664.1 hypothetical protein [Aulosira sp. FACHB-615]
MTKPDFQKMTRKELKKYILSHPTDNEAIRELFITRRNPNAQTFPYPYDMPYEDVEAIFKTKLNLE